MKSPSALNATAGLLIAGGDRRLRWLSRANASSCGSGVHSPTTAPAAPGSEELFARQQFLEDAKAVLDLVWFEVREGLGQFRDGDERATAVDSQSPGSTHGAAVQIDPRWKEIALHADTERGVIDREDADAGDQVADLSNDPVEFIEGRCFP